MLERMHDDHDKLRDIAARLRTLLAAETPCDMEQLAALRWELATTAMQNLAVEERHIYSKLTGNVRAEIALIAEQTNTELRLLFATYVDHSKHWTPERILADWHTYRRAGLDLLIRLLVRLDREERLIYPLLERARIDASTAAPPQTNWVREAFAMKERIGKGVL